MTQEEVREYFDYNAETGELTWRVSKGRAEAGSKAGANNSSKRQYLRVGVHGKHYLAHRLIWLWVHGYLPENQIDHIDGDPMNNRLSNLREVSQSCNIRNAKRFRNNKSGVTGVVWHRTAGKWYAKITVSYQQLHLGYFTNFTLAVRARHQAEVEHNWPGCNSSTDAYQYLANL